MNDDDDGDDHDDDNDGGRHPSAPLPPGGGGYLLGRNPGLASIISQGVKSLEETAADIQRKTRGSSLSQPQKRSARESGVSLLDPRQLAEGRRILDVASDCLDAIVDDAQAGGGTLTAKQRQGLAPAGGDGGPIVLLDCVVNRNVRQAKLYWTLPYAMLLDGRIDQRVYQHLMATVQRDLVHPEGGGAKLLARHVHARLASYYPPRLKMVPATDEMVQRAIEEYMM